MQIMSLSNRIKLFMFLANLLYKIFNVIERNDSVTIPGYEQPFRILDMYDNLTVDVLCDSDPNPLRQRTSMAGIKLYKKFFRSSLRESKNDNGWRSVGGVFINVGTGEILKRGSGSDGLHLLRKDGK